MRYVLTQPVTIPAGTEFEVDDRLGAGGLSHQNDFGLMTVTIGRAAALESGLVVAKPTLMLVEKVCD